MEYEGNKTKGMPGHYMAQGSVADNPNNMGTSSKITGYGFGAKKKKKGMSHNPGKSY